VVKEHFKKQGVIGPNKQNRKVDKTQSLKGIE
jgi:hypothetical protein